MGKKYKESKREAEKENQNYRWFHILFFVAAVIFIIYLRVVPYARYFSPDVPFRDPDTCYHLRRIIYTATHGMQFPFYDPLLAHPHGAIPVWSPLYDWISALPAFILGFGNPSFMLVQCVSMICTLIFGLLELFFIGFLVYKVTKSMTTSILAGFLVGMTDAQITFTSIEIIDHNSLLLLLFVLIILRTYEMLCKNAESDVLKDAVMLSFLIALQFWVWSGAYIYLGVIVLIHFICPLLNKKIWLFSSIAFCYALSGILVAPLALIHYYFGKELLRFEYISLFTVIFLMSISAGFFFISNAMQWKNNNKKAILLLELMVTFLFLAVMLIIIYKPFINGFAFARAENKWLSTVAESKGIFYLEKGPVKEFYLEKVIKKLGYLIFIFPAALIMILIRKIRLPLEFTVILVVNTLVFGYLICSQKKFALEFSMYYGAVLAIFIVWLYWKMVNKFSLALLLIFIAGIGLSLSALADDFKSAEVHFNVYHNAFKWLKEDAGLKETGINSGHVQNDGVIAPWDIGHHLQLYSEVPTVADNFETKIEPFNGFFDMARFFLSEDENTAISIMKKYKCTYVAVTFSSIFEDYATLIDEDPSSYFKFSVVNVRGKKRVATEAYPKFFKTVGLRLGDLYGSANPAVDERMFDVVALKHFRLIYALPETKIAGENVPTGSLKIYKYVEGTKLDVPFSGHIPYKLEALVRINASNSFYYRQKGYLDEGIIAPYPTHPIKDYPYAESYRVMINDRVFEFNDIK